MKLPVWLTWWFCDVATGHIYKTKGGTLWYISVDKNDVDYDVRVYWTPERTGVCYTVPKRRWFEFAAQFRAKLWSIE